MSRIVGGRRAKIDAQEYHALIRGEGGGCTTDAVRLGLYVASGAFTLGGALRRKGYDLGLLRAHSAGVPVISVGNLSVGGTGKTPLVIHLARAALATGERPAILARGYGAARDGELNDELRQIAEEVPGALLCPGKDRVARAAEAVAAGATLLLLDDGFQHRRLARDVDVVVLDATEAWGAPPHRLLPRGLLREPAHALSRADVVVLSRVELEGLKDVERLEGEVRALGFGGPILRMRMRPARLDVLAAPEEDPKAPTRDLTYLSGRPVIAACGIGNPTAFGATLAFLGARTTQLLSLPDHHAYSPADVTQLEELARQRAVETVVVTAKDAVKLRPLLTGARRVTWLTLGVEASLEPSSATEDLLKRIRATDGPEEARGG